MIPSVNGTASTKAFSSGAVNTTSFSHTVAGGLVNSKLVFFGNVRDFGGTPSLNSVTWNGYDFTELINAGINGGAMFVWELPNPVSGTHSIVLTWDVPPNSTTNTVVTVENAGEIDIADVANFSGTTVASMTEDTNFDDELCFQCVYDVNEQVGAYTTGQTEITNYSSGAFWQAVSQLDAPVAGSTTMISFLPHATDGGMAFVSISPPGAGFIAQPIIV